MFESDAPLFFEGHDATATQVKIAMAATSIIQRNGLADDLGRLLSGELLKEVFIIQINRKRSERGRKGNYCKVRKILLTNLHISRKNNNFAIEKNCLILVLRKE